MQNFNIKSNANLKKIEVVFETAVYKYFKQYYNNKTLPQVNFPSFFYGMQNSE